MTGMSTLRSTSVGVLWTTHTPRSTSKAAITMNVCGRRRARRTIHMATWRGGEGWNGIRVDYRVKTVGAGDERVTEERNAGEFRFASSDVRGRGLRSGS